MALLTNPLMTGFDQGVDAPPRWNGLVPDDARGPLTVGDPTDPASLAGTQVGADAARDIVEQTYAKIQAAQQQAADQGQWTGGQVWEGGHPTQAGLLDAIGQMGTAVALGTGSGGDAPAPGFTAYHGSPHAFDQFDLSKIGTGEGAQAYGHGMYLADSEGVARSYRDQLAPTQNLNDLIDKHGGDGDAAFTDLLTKGDYTASELDAMMKYQRTGERPPAGHMYEVNVNADPATFLDWDKPRDQLAPNVQASAEAELSTSMGRRGGWF